MTRVSPADVSELDRRPAPLGVHVSFIAIQRNKKTLSFTVNWYPYYADFVTA
jgi:hypothetical protein